MIRRALVAVSLTAAALAAAPTAAGAAPTPTATPAAVPHAAPVPAQAVTPPEPAMADLGWLLRGSGTLTCGLQVNHLVCHAVAPDVQPPQFVAYGAAEPWLPAGCKSFAFRPGDNAGRPAELTLWSELPGSGCVPGIPQSETRGWCILTDGPTGETCRYEGANLTHDPLVWMTRVDVFGEGGAHRWGTRIFFP